MNVMDIAAEVVEMKQMLMDISRRIDDVLDEDMTIALMKLSEKSILPVRSRKKIRMGVLGSSAVSRIWLTR